MTFVLGFVLSALPLPETIVDWRPCWLAMFLIYWCMALPERVGISSAWFLGLLFDVQQSFIFGQHALGFTFLAYIIVANHRRLRVYPLLQQAIVVFMYLLIYKAIMLLVTFFSGKNRIYLVLLAASVNEHVYMALAIYCNERFTS